MSSLGIARHASYIDADEPVSVITESGAQSSGMTKVVAVGAGAYNSYAVRADGTLWAWGYNFYMQLADGTTTSRKWAQPVPGISGVLFATGGDGHSLVVTASGELFGWGRNDYGQVGIGNTVTRQPTPVSIDDMRMEKKPGIGWKITLGASDWFWTI